MFSVNRAIIDFSKNSLVSNLCEVKIHFCRKNIKKQITENSSTRTQLLNENGECIFNEQIHLYIYNIYGFFF